LTARRSAPHLLSVSTHTTQETLAQVRVEEKTNEIPVAQALLPALPLAGRVVTAEALHTQVETAQVLLDQGADYLLVVKRNQGRLYDDCAAYFSDRRATAARHSTLERRRGRTETRTLYATARLNAHLTCYGCFPASVRSPACSPRSQTGEAHTVPCASCSRA
jgi:predicted transposase YbfD/YdcC